MTDEWVREELERAAREEIHGYLASEATRFACGDGISTSEFNRRLEHLEWIGRIAEAIGRNKAIAIWSEVSATILLSLAADARLVVGDGIADAWLAGVETIPPSEVDPEILAALGEDLGVPDIFPVSLPDPDFRAAYGDDMADAFGDGGDTPSRLVQSSLRMIIPAAFADRDLFDQLGLPESRWDR